MYKEMQQVYLREMNLLLVLHQRLVHQLYRKCVWWNLIYLTFHQMRLEKSKFIIVIHVAHEWHFSFEKYLIKDLKNILYSL